MDGDICHDMVGKSGWYLVDFEFQRNLAVPSEFGKDEAVQTVHIQTCFSWRTPGEYGISLPCMCPRLMSLIIPSIFLFAT